MGGADEPHVHGTRTQARGRAVAKLARRTRYPEVLVALSASVRRGISTRAGPSGTVCTFIDLVVSVTSGTSPNLQTAGQCDLRRRPRPAIPRGA
jgi:hypothetical protein